MKKAQVREQRRNEMLTNKEAAMRTRGEGCKLLNEARSSNERNNKEQQSREAINGEIERILDDGNCGIVGGEHAETRDILE